MRLALALDLASSGGSSPSLDYATISGLDGWWRPTAANVTLSGSSVDELRDASGNAIHVAQSTGAAKPTYNASFAGANNQPSVQFDGGDYLSAASTASLSYERTQAWTAIFCIHSTTAGLDQTVFAKGNPISTGYGVMINAGGAGTMRVGLANSAGNRALGDASVTTTTTTRIIEVTYSGTSLTTGMAVYRDGTSVAVGATVESLSATIINALAFSLGWNQIAGYFVGHLMDMALWSRVLTAGERATIRADMAIRYGVTVA